MKRFVGLVAVEVVVLVGVSSVTATGPPDSAEQLTPT